MSIKIGEIELKKIINGEEVKLKVIGRLTGELPSLLEEMLIESDESIAFVSLKNNSLIISGGLFKVKGREIEAIELDDEETLKVEELEKKLREERVRLREEFIKKEEEFKEFLQNDNYFKEPLKISQGVDSGRYYVSISNRKIKEFVEKALNKFLDGVISSKWVPDYYFPSFSAKYTIHELVKAGKAEIKKSEYGEYLVLNPEVVNELVGLLLESD